jgi:hypothetical protein
MLSLEASLQIFYISAILAFFDVSKNRMKVVEKDL